MHPLTQLKQIRILALLIAPALVALTAAPALATPNCGVITDNLLYPGQPVDTAHAAHFPSGLLNLMCRSNLPNWLLFTRVRGDSDLYVTKHTVPTRDAHRMAYPSGSEPYHSRSWGAYGVRV